MKTITIRIGTKAENNRQLLREILIHNIIEKIIDSETIPTTDIEKQQGLHSRKKEVIIKIALD